MGVRRSTILPFKAALTEKNLPDQAGKVFLVTGASGGIGKELVTILYQHNAKIWLAARSRDKTLKMMDDIKNAHRNSKGQMHFLSLVLDDLTTIRASAEELLAQETRLDVLWNNAGVMVPPQGSKTVQGYELQLGINNLGHFLFTQFLTPLLKSTAKEATPNTVRVVWVSSSAADNAPNPAIDFSNMDYHIEEGIWAKYSRSKAGNVIHSAEYARRHKADGIISMVGLAPQSYCRHMLTDFPQSLNPGNFVTNLQQNMPKMQLAMFKLISHPPKNGAYTELFAGLDASITIADTGGWVSPFGKKEEPRKDFADAELGRQYWEWSEAQVKPYS
ncbi:hypothetical protein ACJ41O_006066 [Fusarium nematophilum]